VQLTLVPLHQRGRRAVGITVLLRDVSEEAALQEALRREHEVSEELRRLDVLKDEFLSTAAHELRAPLTSIAGFASLLARTAPDRAEFVEPIERNARDMQRLVEALLDQARLESGRVTVEPTRFALAPAVNKLLSDAPEQLGSSPVVIEIADDATIDMDEQAFSLVLGNLVTNAAKYGADGTITISARQEPDFVTVSVTDEGPGIPEEHQAHLFEPFFRVPGDQWSIRGTGFGLSIVRRYVELHGGEVTCDSSPGIGTTFAFTVPRIHPG
jgi:signal transduction histidine kinase